MGSCGSKDVPTSNTKTVVTAKSTKSLKKAVMKTGLKVLILGLPNSGKTTLLKQIRHLYGRDFTTKEQTTFKADILREFLLCTKTLASIGDDVLQASPRSDTRQKSSQISVPDVYLVAPAEEKQESPKHLIYGSIQTLASTKEPNNDEAMVVTAHVCLVPEPIFRDVIHEKVPLKPADVSRNASIRTAKISTESLASKKAGRKLSVDNGCTSTFQETEIELRFAVNVIKSFQEGSEFSTDLANAIEYLWKDDRVKKALEMAQIPECLELIMSPCYTPTPEDAMHTKLASTPSPLSFTHNECDYLILDTLRDSKTHISDALAQFEYTGAIYFVVSLDSYDLEGHTTKSSQCKGYFGLSCSDCRKTVLEAYDLFKLLCNHSLLPNTKMVLRKITKKPFGDYIEEYKGANTFLGFVKAAPEKDIVPYVLSAVNIKQMKTVLESVL
ncbi:hypothetical protein BCR33DRAFT_721805 [Rhizoclosmatium globosum]|uniref:G domain-containing protein n=1 Tax=Rhizoclosmatium globosum TaxID=329046 RepID=A0A1Y2BQ60_9FUNG|nr:hypothetical protein BCR33DRAFT_721805 [Rhizoclosmatium globosum]|eukprot:ORY36879.1 hypothetical protein BCR33DRAFT_721805 [Rhizoclosmatium globosum]